MEIKLVKVDEMPSWHTYALRIRNETLLILRLDRFHKGWRNPITLIPGALLVVDDARAANRHITMPFKTLKHLMDVLQIDWRILTNDLVEMGWNYEKLKEEA